MLQQARPKSPSLQDDRGRPDLQRVSRLTSDFNVGRLDAQTSGLLILWQRR
jgi:16S rRNA U516 pseudouridylate synthase RsuA-like enzyme